ncbi:hypothetical protein PF001_g14130 [Phytophthora fragariae]|uniref:Uncharacterized protein n=1 Tax=Phytophthora fragariae TaxID=53985 RepID=A0A6A4DH00_9STRA|nr:hypothetical protein PF001_g14130 [Phytophthora fragariae]
MAALWRRSRVEARSGVQQGRIVEAFWLQLFTHVCPSELYIDDKMVLHSDNCQADYPGGPNDSGIMPEMPIDYSSCNGNCIFSIYWLGFQNARWQSYINCVPLSGSGETTQVSAGWSVGTNTTEIVSDEAQSSSTQ